MDELRQELLQTLPKVTHLPPSIGQWQSQQLNPGDDQSLFASPGLWEGPREATVLGAWVRDLRQDSL